MFDLFDLSLLRQHSVSADLIARSLVDVIDISITCLKQFTLGTTIRQIKKKNNLALSNYLKNKNK